MKSSHRSQRTAQRTAQFAVAILALAVLTVGALSPDKGALSPDKKGARVVRIALIVHTESPILSFTRREAKRLFLRQSTKWQNVTIRVFRQHSRNPIRDQFSQAVLGKRAADLNEYWLNLKLTKGLKQPKTLRTASLVKQYVKRVKGGVGYVYESEVDDTVRVVDVIKVEIDD